MTVHNNLKSDAIVCTVLILTSVCCLFVLNVFGNQNDKYQTNRVSSKYLRSIFELSSDTTRLITPNKWNIIYHRKRFLRSVIIIFFFYSIYSLKKCLSFGLLKALHSPEFYNGVPLADDTIEITERTRVYSSSSLPNNADRVSYPLFVISTSSPSDRFIAISTPHRSPIRISSLI